MWTELPRVKFEKGIITLDIFERNNPIPVFHIKGNIKDKQIRNQIADVKAKYGTAFFSDIIDFIEINRSLSELKKELKDIQEMVKSYKTKKEDG